MIKGKMLIRLQAGKTGFGEDDDFGIIMIFKLLGIISLFVPVTQGV